MIITSISSLVFLLPIHGQVHSEGATTPPLIKHSTNVPIKKSLKKPVAAIKLPAEPKPHIIASTAIQPATGVVNCGDSFYKQFIYQHESGCRTNAINPIGACGLGQALPCSKMPCSLSDFACQDAFFTAYAISTYGGWQQAYYAWLSKSWW